MNSIIGMTEVMLRSSHEKKEKEYLNNMYRSGQSLLNIINDVLDYSKIESGKMQLVNENYSVFSLFHDLKVTMQNLIEKKRLSLFMIFRMIYHVHFVEIRGVYVRLS